jgi:diguanylate cyclase (GGDEF)-like protein
MRPEDVLARFGGDEFIVLARATSLRNAEILAERICTRIEALSVELMSRRLCITASSGVAAMGSGAGVSSAEALLAVADRALYRAKAAGRNRVVASAVHGGDSSFDSEPPRHQTQPPKA